MRERIEDALKQHAADYVEIRIEETRTTGITYRGKDLEEVGTTTQLGGNVRAAVNGGWGFVSFNRIADLRDKVSQAVSQARLVGNEKTELVDVPPVQDVVHVAMQRDPSAVSLAEKKQLMDSYVEEIWRTPKIQTSTVGYGDSYRKQYFGNSTGTYIEQERGRVFARFGVVARDNGNVQQSRAGFASSEDYSVVEDRHEDVREAAEKAVAMLDAQPPKGGEFMVILDSTLAGVFAHEAFGHLSEADHVYENDKLREIMVLGRTFGGKFLNITDSGQVPGLTGSFAFDDEGVPTGKQYLIREGELVGRLHSRETAGKMNEAPTGNARAQSYSVPPLVRMRNTAIEPGGNSARGNAVRGERRRLLQELVRRPDQHGDVHVLLYGGLCHSRRQVGRAVAGRESLGQCFHDAGKHRRRRQRLCLGPGGRHVRQGRTVGSGGRRQSPRAH